MTQDTQPRKTRQELYQEIRKTSKDEYILSEMIRLGFWEADKDKPTLSETFIKRRADLLKELRELGKELALYDDPEKALQEMHKQRKKEALENREKTKQNRNKERFEKAQQQYQRRLQTIDYLGEHISAGMAQESPDLARLTQRSLPSITSDSQFAEMMGISISELRFLSFKRDVSKISHYQHFAIPKKTGGVRDIAAPMPRLKRAQYWILDNILNAVEIDESAHGFVAGRSIVTNAEKHTNKDVVINLDLENFFPSISFKRVKGVFKSIGYSEHLASILASLSTDAKVDMVELDGETFYVAAGEPHLPQGAPTSPALTNIICRKLDKRLNGVAESLGFVYSRYADDMTFSGNNIDADKIKKLMWRITSVVKDESFTINRKKTRIMRKHRQQEVTGIVVNNGLSIDRKTLKKFRALLFQINKDGPEGKTWGHGELFACIQGYANFVAMVKPEKGIPLQKKVVDLKRQFNYSVKPGKINELNKKLFRAKAAKGESPRESWWSPKLPEPPVLEKTALQVANEKREAKEKLRQEQQPNRQGGRGDSRQESEEVQEFNYARLMIILSWIMLFILWVSR